MRRQAHQHPHHSWAWRAALAGCNGVVLAQSAQKPGVAAGRAVCGREAAGCSAPPACSPAANRGDGMPWAVLGRRAVATPCDAAQKRGDAGGGVEPTLAVGGAVWLGAVAGRGDGNSAAQPADENRVAMCFATTGARGEGGGGGSAIEEALCRGDGSSGAPSTPLNTHRGDAFEAPDAPLPGDAAALPPGAAVPGRGSGSSGTQAATPVAAPFT